MKLIINGEPRSFQSDDPTLSSLLTDLDLARKPVVVELNREPVLPGDHATTPVKDGDTLEIVTIAAGG